MVLTTQLDRRLVVRPEGQANCYMHWVEGPLSDSL